VAANDILPLAQALAAGIGGATYGTIDNGQWIEAVVADLKANRGASVVIAGETQPPEVHAVVAQMNAALGNTGQTVSTAPIWTSILPVRLKK
jgi:molybdopterin-containing oxidoreductase family iron-sulfur binding subunit